MPTPQFNIIKRVVNFSVATITTDNIRVNATALANTPYTGSLTEPVRVVNEEFDALNEANNVSSLLREFARNAAVDGDGCMFSYWDANVPVGHGKRGAIRTEIISNTRVIFGNPNDRLVQNQPYIQIVKREIARNVRKRAKENGSPAWANITPDTDASNATDSAKYTDDKVTMLLTMWRDEETGEIWAYESTQSCSVKEPYNLGIRLYPICWLCWDYIALETIGAVTRAGGSTESAMKLLSPKQIEAYNNYRAERNAAEEAANKPATPKAKNVTGDELAALDKALKGYDEQTRNDIIEEYRKAVEGEAPISFDAKVNREATRAMREAEAREKGIEVFKPAYDEDALDIAERRVTARKEARYQDKRKPVATPENSEYDDTRFKFDYEAARKKAEKAYDLELKRWYAEHPNESEPDPDSWLSDRSAYISEYVRRLSRIEFAEHKKANELISKAQLRDRNLGKTGETHQETRQDDYRRDDEAYKDNVDEDWDTNSRRTDISGNKVDVYGTRSISRGTFRSDAEAPPVTAAERRYAKLIGKERADSIEKREAARAAVTENATERMERMAAENKLLRKVAEAKTEEERALAQEEYKKFKDNEAANLAAKNGGEDDVHRIRYDEVRGRPGLESGDRGNIENVRRDAGSRELGRLSEVVRHADPAERGQRLEEAGYKIIIEREHSSEEVKASKIVNDLVGDDANVVILAGEGIDIGLAHTESDGRSTIFLVRKPNSRYRMEDVAVHEAAHIRMPEGIKSNAHQYAKYLLLNNGFT